MNAVLKTLRWPATDRDRKRTALWTADEVAEATGGAASGAFQAAGVEMDSRDVRSGDLFFALKGESLDGHLYAVGSLEHLAELTGRSIDVMTGRL